MLSKDGLDALVFVPAPLPVGEFGGGVASSTSVGFYVGTPEKYVPGMGAGGYVNVTTNAACKVLRSRKKG